MSGADGGWVRDVCTWRGIPFAISSTSSRNVVVPAATAFWFEIQYRIACELKIGNTVVLLGLQRVSPALGGEERGHETLLNARERQVRKGEQFRKPHGLSCLTYSLRVPTSSSGGLGPS